MQLQREIVSGGAGRDSFSIATAELLYNPNTITGFEARVDIIGVAGLGMAFEDLHFHSQWTGSRSGDLN